MLPALKRAEIADIATAGETLVTVTNYLGHAPKSVGRTAAGALAWPVLTRRPEDRP